jgi:hypothetical protein
VRGNADVPDFPGFFRLFKSFIQAVFGVEDFIQGGYIVNAVELVQVDIVGIKSFEAKVEVFLNYLSRAGEGLGGDKDIMAPSLDRLADALLAGGVAVSGIKIIDAQFETSSNNGYSVIFRESLDGNAAEAQPRYHHFRLAQS